jgi:hypothetical protein
VIEAEELARSPAWLPIEARRDGTVRLVRLDEEAYREASFLDQRLLERGYAQDACDLAALEAAVARLTVRAHYIFHTGHVGSTLVSRLIGAHPGFFSLREPALLRALAMPGPAESAPRLETALALLSRTWRPGQRAVVKATSFVSELAGPILGTDPEASAIYMFTEPLTYLRGILAGPNSRAETARLGPARLERLARRARAPDFTTAPRSEGEWIAMSWLCEIGALIEAADSHPARVLWVDFDRFLEEPREGLEDIFKALGARPVAREIETLVASSLMRRYSKAPEHAYDAALRRAVLASAELEHAPEVRQGMQWLEQRAARHPLARRAFEISSAGRL